MKFKIGDCIKVKNYASTGKAFEGYENHIFKVLDFKDSRIQVNSPKGDSAWKNVYFDPNRFILVADLSIFENLGD